LFGFRPGGLMLVILMGVKRQRRAEALGKAESG
jgi:hypothetical protein